MTITYVWSEIRERAITAFRGELPGSDIENAIIEVFERRPALVLATVEAVSSAFAAGSIRSGWAVLRSRLRAEEARAEITATDSSDREKAISRAEQWMRAAGKHFDRESEILDELFGDFGRLKSWAHDDELRARMVSLWCDVRPEGELIERHEIERAELWKRTTGLRWAFERDPKFRERYIAEHPELVEELTASEHVAPVGEEPALA